MSRRRHTPEQVVRKLREADRLLGEGMELPEVWKYLEVSEATYHRWRNQFGGMKADDVKRLKELEAENQRLKRIVADQLLENQALREVSRGKLVSPQRRRRAVLMLQDRLGLSERRACRYVGQSRSTQRREPVVAQDDAALRAELRVFSRKRPRWGYRQAHQHLLDQGWSINRKRVQRLWREEGLRVPPKRRKRLRRGDSTVPGDRLRAERPDHVWAFDFQFDVTDDGRALKLLYVVDEFTREALAMEAERRIDGDKVVDVLDRIIREQGRRPQLLRCDNGPEMTSNALRDWCKFSRTGAAFIEPGSPWENPFVESFNSRVRDELLSVEIFTCLAEAKVMVEDFRQDYNRSRPHRAHGMMTPEAFKTGWETAHRAAPDSAELQPAYGRLPFDAVGTLTLKEPTTTQLSQQVDP